MTIRETHIESQSGTKTPRVVDLLFDIRGLGSASEGARVERAVEKSQGNCRTGEKTIPRNGKRKMEDSLS